MSVSELSAVLANSDPLRVLSSVDSLCRSLAGKPYLLSTSFYPSFGLLLHRLLSVSFQGSVPPLVCSVPRAWDLLRPSGSLFELLFNHSAFPPKYALPVSSLPQPCRDFLHSPAVSSSSSSFSSAAPSAACWCVGPLLRSSYQASSDCLQLSIHDYLFFSLALFLTRDLPATVKLLSSLPPLPPSLHQSGVPHFNTDDCYRAYQSVVQQYLILFVPNASAVNAAAGGAVGGVSVASRSLHCSSLVAVLAEVWMCDAASRMLELSSSSLLHSGMSSGTGVSSPPSIPSPFLSPPSASTASSLSPSTSSSYLSASSMSASSLSSADQSVAASFSFPSVRVLGCVRLLVTHLLSVPPPPAATARQPVPSSSSASSSGSLSTALPSAVWSLSLASVDVCLFRFLRSCLLRPPSQYDDRLLLVVSVWLSVLAHTVSPNSPPAILHASFAFFSVLLVDFLHSLLDVDVGREGSAMRAASLKQCVQLFSVVQSCRAELERVEQLLLFMQPDAVRKGASRSHTRQHAASLLRSTLGSRSSTQQQTEAIRSQFMRLAAQLPDEQYARLFTRSSNSAQQQGGVQQLVVQAVRYLTPASVRQGPAPLSFSQSQSASASAARPFLSSPSAILSAGRSSAHLLQSTSAFRSQLIAEAAQFDTLTQLAVRTFDLPLEAIDDAQDSAESSVRQQELLSPSTISLTSATARSSAGSVDTSLSPSRLRSDPYQRLSSTGRQQLARGVALCSKHSNALRFVGGDWDRPVASNECATAVRLLHTLHTTLTATAGAQHEGQHYTPHAMLGQLTLRTLARWDVLSSAVCALLLVVLVIIAAVLS